MLRTAAHVLGRYGAGEADDAVQEAFLAALTTEALPSGDLGAWLRAIAARKALDLARRSNRRREDALAEGPAGEEVLPAADDVAARAAVLDVRRALARLSPADRAVLTLVDLEGHSMVEAARQLGLTHVAVRLRAVRARRKLAKLLRGTGGQEV